MFRERLKQLRKENGITQEQLAGILGVERSSVGKYEGKSRIIPSDDVKQRMAEYFGVSVDYLLGRTDTRTIDENKNQPTTNSDGLDEKLVNLLVDLSPAEVQRVRDFVAGLKASRKEESSQQ